MAAPPTHRWQPVEDLPDDFAKLASPELKPLANVWREQKDLLEQTDALRRFNERLHRKWAIETGIIERVYTLDRGITQLLIEHGIDADLIPSEATDKDPQLVAQIIRDHEAAIEGLFAFVRGERRLSTSYIKELHAVLTRNQHSTTGIDQLGRTVEFPLERGAYKRIPNNPTREDGSVHEYCPPEHVDAEMDRLVELHHRHTELAVAAEVEAAWLHHRFTQIHPFQDGNGRVARALASLVLIRTGWFPLVVTRDDRLQYIDALEAADAGDLNPLVAMFSSIEKRAFVGALSEAGSVLEQRRVDHVIAAARNVLERRQAALREEWEHARDIAQQLLNVSHERFDGVAATLRREIGRYNDEYRFRADVERFDGDRDHYFRWQIIETAKELDYFANPAPGYRAWSRLILHADDSAEILLSIHGIGHEFRGVLAASMCFFRREETEEGERELADRATLANEVFQINYLESDAEVQDRFERWLEEGLIRGLEIWRAGL